MNSLQFYSAKATTMLLPFILFAFILVTNSQYSSEQMSFYRIIRCGEYVYLI